MELRSLANGVPFLYSDFKFNLNTKNKVFPVPVSVCCLLNLFNLSIDAFNGAVGKCTTGHILDELFIFNKRFDGRKELRTNVLTYASDAVAQFTFSLLLEVTSQVGLNNQLVHENRWAQAPDFTFWEKPLLELKGKTLGLIGYGHIAQKVAKIGHAFSIIEYGQTSFPAVN